MRSRVYILISSSPTCIKTDCPANSGLRFVGSYLNEVHLPSSDIIPRLLHAISLNPMDIPNLQYAQLGKILRLNSKVNHSPSCVISTAVYHIEKCFTTLFCRFDKPGIHCTPCFWHNPAMLHLLQAGFLAVQTALPCKTRR